MFEHIGLVIILGLILLAMLLVWRARGRARQAGSEFWELARREHVDAAMRLGQAAAVCLMVAGLVALPVLLGMFNQDAGQQAVLVEQSERLARLEAEIRHHQAHRHDLADANDALQAELQGLREQLAGLRTALDDAQRRVRLLIDGLPVRTSPYVTATLVRDAPGGAVISSIESGAWVNLRHAPVADVDGQRWVPITDASGQQGWVADRLLELNPEVMALLESS
ncbi:MAG: hypothetical protein ABF271_04770 [Abyssibacter sp.]|uniref:hypothetical protein n=1 Tax=Abyssibacter sp. TaxID=2320200 RepID=UPI00321AAD5E